MGQMRAKFMRMSGTRLASCAPVVSTARTRTDRAGGGVPARCGMLRRVAALAAMVSLLIWLPLPCASGQEADQASREPARAIVPAVVRSFVAAHCLDCHDRDSKTAGLALDDLLAAELPDATVQWEKVVRKLATRQMPPKDAPKPDERSYQATVAALTGVLDRLAAERPRPGRTETFRRLTRTEYQNAIRDLLALQIDAAALLPADEASHGFDNITVSDLSPTLLNRYVAAAQKIARLAVGRVPEGPLVETFRVRADITQDVHLEGLPIGTRGGLRIDYHFPQDGQYEVQVHLMRDRNDEIESLREPHELEIAVDRQRVALLTVRPPPRGTSDRLVDANLKARFAVAAGPHTVTVAFLKSSSSLLETMRQPLNVHFNFYRHPRLGPAVFQVALVGPYEPQGPGDTPSRRRIFVCRPSGPQDELACARQILSTLARRAYRRPVTEEDLAVPLSLYQQGHAQGGFEAGIEAGLAAILVSPHFLFRIERDPEGVAAGQAYRISDLELASRLSFFLWSSLPDDELLELAEAGTLSRPEVLTAQVRRMLADPRSRSLVTNFAGQWLHLRNLDSLVPDMRLYPDFDDNLRQALRRETELCFEEIIREDHSVLRLIRSEATYLNERLAKHYGIPHIYGSRLRRVVLDETSQRGGLLRQGSILAVTSYATRTSPVLRGQWVLKNLMGTPPPPPPPNVPALEENVVAASLPVRERLAQHRRHAACAACHEIIDPVGFALEHYDAIGRWRALEAGQPIDDAGSLPDGTPFVGVAGLEAALVARGELFVQTLVEKLLTYALGRGVDEHDAPAVRQIVRQARAADDRFSSLILGIVQSVPFQMRSAP
jgi:mono/diheme cytochrome c family protein